MKALRILISLMQAFDKSNTNISSVSFNATNILFWGYHYTWHNCLTVSHRRGRLYIQKHIILDDLNWVPLILTCTCFHSERPFCELFLLFILEM